MVNQKKPLLLCLSVTNVGAESPTGSAAAIINPPKPAAASGLVQGVLDGDDDDGEGENNDYQKIGTDLKSGGQPNNGKPTRLLYPSNTLLIFLS